MALTTYGRPLTAVLSFKYLWWFLLASENDWLVVIQNLWRAHQTWERMPRLLGREGADAQTLGIVKTMLVQSVLLYGSKKWFMYPPIGKNLGGFHYQVIPRLMGRMLQYNRYRT